VNQPPEIIILRRFEPYKVQHCIVDAINDPLTTVVGAFGNIIDGYELVLDLAAPNPDAAAGTSDEVTAVTDTSRFIHQPLQMTLGRYGPYKVLDTREVCGRSAVCSVFHSRA
jgi:hypothetical protein